MISIVPDQGPLFTSLFLFPFVMILFHTCLLHPTMCLSCYLHVLSTHTAPGTMGQNDSGGFSVPLSDIKKQDKTLVSFMECFFNCAPGTVPCIIPIQSPLILIPALGGKYQHSPHFPDVGTEAEAGESACLQAASLEVAEALFKARPSPLQSPLG